MKTYQNHMASRDFFGAGLSIMQKPVYRSSAVFPVLNTVDITTKVTFLGYWLLKRQITEIGLLITVRDSIGVMRMRKAVTVEEPKVYVIQPSLLCELEENFTGSVELEVFSSRDMVYPYPAFVVTYDGKEVSTAVHTVGRIYNDLEDIVENEERRVPESGFDVHGAADGESFLAFTNGPMENANAVLTCDFVNATGVSSSVEINLGHLPALSTRFVKFSDYVDLNSHFGGQSGTAKISHNLEGFFPRFLCGNFFNGGMSVTHTFYDCSSCDLTEDYWERESPDYHDSAIAIPIFKHGNGTSIVVYPVFSPSEFSMDIEFFDAGGQLLHSKRDALVRNAAQRSVEKIQLNTLVPSEYEQQIVSAKIIANWNGKVPSRLKLGLNVGGEDSVLPCNICFAPSLGETRYESKTSTFKWAPLLNRADSKVVVTNSSPRISYTRDAECEIEVYREQDCEVLRKQVMVPPNGIYTLSIRDDDIANFVGDEVAWVVVKSSNAFVNCWYFDFFPNGAVAADHSF